MKGHFVASYGENAFTEAGYTMIPNALIEAKVRLGISHLEMDILVNVIYFIRPQGYFPNFKHLADRVGIEKRSLRRSFEALEKKGILKRERMMTAQGREYTRINLKPLIDKINARYDTIEKRLKKPEKEQITIDDFIESKEKMKAEAKICAREWKKTGGCKSRIRTPLCEYCEIEKDS